MRGFCGNLLSIALASFPLFARSAGLDWNFPDAREVELGGVLGEAYQRGRGRLSEDPYRSAAYLRSDISFETNRIFVNYSGDISGRFIEVASLMSPPGRMEPATLPQVLENIGAYQKADGHFGRDVDWNMPLEPESPNAVLLPIFWGNSRLLMGLIESYRACGRPDLLQAAKRLGDFYIATADRFLDPKREPEYRATGSYAAGYVTDYLPGIDGLVNLYAETKDERYLRQAERMAEFFGRFDTLPIDHSHGNLITHHGLLLLYEATGKREYLERPLRQWQRAVDGGYVWPMGGVGEKFRVSFERDEGCSEADWLRLNLRLWKLTGETRFLDMADRLLWNHYAMNRTTNGGYGHHEFVCDEDGPLLMKPEFTEAVWCCTFHGLLGLHTLKRYVAVGSPKGVFVNFPFETEVPLEAGREKVRVRIRGIDSRPDRIRFSVDLSGGIVAGKYPEVFVRKPGWVSSVSASDGEGKAIRFREKDGYLRFSSTRKSGGPVVISFNSTLRLEDRRMRPVKLGPGKPNQLRGVTLSLGPCLLFANGASPRPVLVAGMRADGSLNLVPDRNGSVEMARAANLNLAGSEFERLRASPDRLLLSPWEQVNHREPVAFVYDLMLFP